MADQARVRKDEKTDNLIYVQRKSQLTYWCEDFFASNFPLLKDFSVT